MKKFLKVVGVTVSLVLFAGMALGSGSSEGEKKEIVNDSGASGSGSSDDKKQDAGSKDKVSIEEQVLVDQDGIKITATEYTEDSIFGDGIKLLIENNTDKNVTVGCSALIVNNYNISDLFAADVAAGKKANETMHLSTTELNAAGINTVGQVEIYFHIYDSDSWDKVLDTDAVVIKTSQFENMDTTPNDSGAELYNKDGIRIVGKALNEDTFWGSGILLYIENNTKKNIGISVENVSINGFMVDTLFSATVYSGKMAIDDITIFSSTLEENGIESIDEVELSFKIYDEKNFNTIAETDVIKFSAK